MTTLAPIIFKAGNRFKSLMNLRPGVHAASIRLVVSSNNDATKVDKTKEKEPDPDLPIENVKNPFEREKIKCILCEHNIKVDYKNVRLLSQFVSRYTGRIYGRHITRLCKAQQKIVERETIKAQSAGLMGYYTRDLAYSDDPQLFNPEQSLRSHRF